MCQLLVEIEGKITLPKLWVAPNIDRSMILGEDWLKKNWTQIRFNQNLNGEKGKNTAG